MGNHDILIKHELRPCLVDAKDDRKLKALFHNTLTNTRMDCLNDNINLYGQLCALIELEDGRLDVVPIETVHLLDTAKKMREYDFGEQEEPETDIAVKSCENCKHYPLSAAAYPCSACEEFEQWEPKA